MWRVPKASPHIMKVNTCQNITPEIKQFKKKHTNVRSDTWQPRCTSCLQWEWAGGVGGCMHKLTSTHDRHLSKAGGLRMTCEKKNRSRLLSCLSLLDIWHISICPHCSLILLSHTNTSTSEWTLLHTRPHWGECASVSIKQTSSHQVCHKQVTPDMTVNK